MIKNEERRHWASQTQKAYVLLDLVEKSYTNQCKDENRVVDQIGKLPLKMPKSRKILADMLGVSEADVSRAKQIIKRGGEVAEKVASGELPATIAIKKISLESALDDVSKELKGKHKDVVDDIKLKIKEGKLKSVKAIRVEAQKQVYKKEGKYLPVSDAMQYADFAIAQLERINDDDPKKNDAFKKVKKWIRSKNESQ